VSRLYDEQFRGTGLRSTQYAILHLLRDRGDVRQRELCELTMHDETTLTRNLRPLVEAGWMPAYKPLKDQRSQSEKDLGPKKQQREDWAGKYRGLADPAGSDRKQAQAILSQLETLDHDIDLLNEQINELKKKLEPHQKNLAPVGLGE
jgi:DNA-binding MarR family transcriptional regulator